MLAYFRSKKKIQKNLQEHRVYPADVLNRIFHDFDLYQLLSIRQVCSSWSNYVEDLLSSKAALRIHPSMDNLKKWKSTQIKFIPSQIPWTDLRVHMLQHSKFLFKNRKKLFLEVSVLTLYDDNFSLTDLQKMFKALPNILKLDIINHKFDLEIRDHFGPAGKSSKLQILSLHQLEHFTLCLYFRKTSLIYLNIVISSKPQNLLYLSLDFSKLLGEPITTEKLIEIYSTIGKLLTIARNLETFKLSFAHRVESDSNIKRYEKYTEPWNMFMELVQNPTKYNWPTSFLKLQLLKLNFPIIHFENSDTRISFVNYICKNMPDLKTIFLNRCKVTQEFCRLNAQTQVLAKPKWSYGIWLSENLSIMRFPILTNIVHQDIFLNKIYIMNVSEFIMSEHPIVTSLKLIQGEQNFMEKFELNKIAENYQNLQELEIIDNSSTLRNQEGFISIGDEEFNFLISNCRQLKSLKLSNLFKLTNSGLTGIERDEISRMNNNQVYFSQEFNLANLPMAKLKSLKYLDLRRLTKKVTDVSIFYGFQHLPKLEIISFNGNMKISEWGLDILRKKFRHNPLFRATIKGTTVGHSTDYLYDFP